MAKTYTMRETYELLKEGNPKARQELGKRFPLVSTATIEEIMACLPDVLTARKVETALRKFHNLSDNEEQGAEDVAPEEKVEKVEKEEKKTRTRKVKEPEEKAPPKRTRKPKAVKVYTENELSEMTDEDLEKVGKELGLYEDCIDLDALYDAILTKQEEAAPPEKKARAKKVEEKGIDPDFVEFENFE